MRVLIVGSLSGELGRAAGLAAARGARVAQALGMDVIATRRGSGTGEVPGVRQVDLETLFRESDVLSVHCPLTAETRGLVNAGRLALMKPSAFVLNTSRGPIIDEAVGSEPGPHPSITRPRVRWSSMTIRSATQSGLW